MRIRPFEYHPAESLEEALAVLAQAGPEAFVLAGGTDLLLDMKHGLKPGLVVDLGGIAELARFGLGQDEIRIGPLATHAALTADRRLADSVPVLTQALGLIGSWQIRNVATLGGNLCHASPAADSAGPLLALGARVEAVGPKGSREIPLGQFFTGPGQTSLLPGELLKEIVIPRPASGAVGRYLKLMRKHAVDLALLGVAVQLVPDSAGERIESAAIGLGGLAPTPIRAAEAEGLLTGLSLDQAEKAIGQAARAAVAASSPIDDVRASASYRKTVTEVYVRRGLSEVLTRLRGEGAKS